MHATQLDDALSDFCFTLVFLSLVDDVAANTLDVVLVFVTFDCVFSSTLILIEAVFIRSWASALSFNQSLKSIKVGRSRLRLTVCIDQASLMFGGSFCTA